LGDKTGSHTFISELSSFEVGTSGTRRTTVFHVSTLESGTSEVLSESAGKGFSVDDNGSSTTEAGRGNVAGEGLTAASEPLVEQTLGETESVDDLMHHADHVLFVNQDISSSLNVIATDGGSTDKGSLGSRS